MVTLLRSLKYKMHQLVGLAPTHRRTLKIKTERHGSGYGGWVVAQEFMNKDSIVYSVGLGTDITFDISLMEKYQIPVYGFDPTPNVEAFIRDNNSNPAFHFFPYGISDRDDTEKFFLPANPNHISHSKTPSFDGAAHVDVPMKRLKTVMQELNHSRIDVLKMDIEGFEYSVLENILNEGLDIRQILVEFHHNMYKDIKIKNTNDIVDKLEKAGYQIFYISPSIREYSFIKSV